MELTGLEWEAEKAYIVATSPRNLSHQQLENSDEFSWEVAERGTRKQGDEETQDVVQEKPTEAVAVDVPQLEDHEQQERLTAPLPNEDVNAATPTVRTILKGVLRERSRPRSSRPKSVQLVEITFDQNSDSSSPPVSPTSPSSLPTTTTPTVPPPTTTTMVIFGPSGLGKSTLVQKLVYKYPQKFSKVVSHTTRQPKMHETYARDFFFVSRADMLKGINEDKFIEYVQIDCKREGKSYSTPSNPRLSTGPMDTTVIFSGSEGAELYGTSWDAYYEAQFSGKPCTVLNVSRKGAEQMRRNGIEGHYVLLYCEYLSYPCLSFQPDYTISIGTNDAFSELERFALELIKGQLPSSSSSKLENTRLEWERVANIQLDSQKRSPALKTHRQQVSQLVVSFSELLNHFQTADLSKQLSTIHPEVNRSGLSKLFGPKRISKRIQRERDLVFAIALCQFNDHNPLHSRCLTTIYRKLTGRTTSCLRFGAHWEEIGFQGSDPVDDLRGVGMLGLLQLVWLLESPDVNSLAQEVFRYSKEGPPFCVLSFNITSIMLAALREGCLSRECNRRDQVFAVANDFHVAILLSFYHVWRKHKRGPMELGLLLQDVGKYAKKHPHSLMHDLQTYLHKQQRKFSLPELMDNTLPVEFTQLEANDPISV